MYYDCTVLARTSLFLDFSLLIFFSLFAFKCYLFCYLLLTAIGLHSYCYLTACYLLSEQALVPRINQREKKIRMNMKCTKRNTRSEMKEPISTDGYTKQKKTLLCMFFIL